MLVPALLISTCEKSISVGFVQSNFICLKVPVTLTLVGAPGAVVSTLGLILDTLTAVERTPALLTALTEIV